jgi:large subunit ribosomal protein L7A
MPDRLKSAKKKFVGTKQTLKAVENGKAKVVYYAKDAEDHVLRPLLKACKEKAIEVVTVDTMQQLGKICGIEIGAAAAAWSAD